MVYCTIGVKWKYVRGCQINLVLYKVSASGEVEEGNDQHYYATYHGIFLYIGVETHVVNLADPRLPLTTPNSLEEPRMTGTEHDPDRDAVLLVVEHGGRISGEDGGGRYGYGEDARSRRAFGVTDGNGVCGFSCHSG